MFTILKISPYFMSLTCYEGKKDYHSTGIISAELEKQGVTSDKMVSKSILCVAKDHSRELLSS